MNILYLNTLNAMKPLRNLLRNSKVLRTVVAFGRFLKAYVVYRRTGVTPDYGYFSTRILHFATRGRFNNMYAWWHNTFGAGRKLEFANPQGVLGIMAPANAKYIADDIRENGFHIFDAKLPAEMCSALTEYALTMPAKPRGKDTPPLIYNRANPVTNIYDFEYQTILENKIIQQLIIDTSILAIAQEYVGRSASLYTVNLWWSNAHIKNVNLTQAAQLHHVDLDTIKWLNLFFYLTDVTAENGPHCYVARSHRHKPDVLWRDGRVSDEEISRYYKPHAVKEILGGKGTVIAADTLGFHKGVPLVSGDRLMMQLTFAVTHFGFNAPVKITMNDKFTPEFVQNIKEHQHIYNGFFSV